MRIGIHADGGPGVGLGHVGRCAALAQALRTRGASIEFVDVPAACRPWLSARGFATVLSAAHRWDLLVADSYRLTRPRWENLRRRAAKNLVVDDFGRFRGHCDWILNGHVYAPKVRFSTRPSRGLLLGPKFLPLRSEYWTTPSSRRAPSRVRRVLVTTGGSSADIAQKIGSIAASALPHASIRVLLSPLARAVAPRPRAPRNLSWLKPVRSLLPLLRSSDVVICAGGQTIYEAACTGTPAIAVSLADNQDDNIRGMSAAGSALPAGVPSSAHFAERLSRLLKRLDASPAARQKMSNAGRRVVDGRGALRVADTVFSRS